MFIETLCTIMYSVHKKPEGQGLIKRLVILNKIKINMNQLKADEYIGSEPGYLGINEARVYGSIDGEPG